MNIFKNSAPAANLQHSTFDVGNNNIMSSDFGEIRPCYVNDVIPGDDWTIKQNVLVKVAPLVAPAFTRIKSYVNSFYVSNQSIWQYWNNFIANRPDDVYPNAQLQEGYDNLHCWQVPYFPTNLVQAICKIAYGMAKIDDAGNVHQITYYSLSGNYTQSNGVYPHYFDVNYVTLKNGGSFRYELIQNSYHRQMFEIEDYDYVPKQIVYDDLTDFRNLGMDDQETFLIDSCKKCVKLFDNMGIPVELLAVQKFSYYKDEKINALPFMAYSKIWNIYFRDEQLQSADLCFRKANGPIYDNSQDPSIGWVLELIDLPPNTYNESTQLENFIPIADYSNAFSIMTGYGLKKFISEYNTKITGSGTSNYKSMLNLPSYYNGLCRLKYRNFNPDYFSSAVLDPMAGARNISVPDTITELRSASKLQEFLERSAWARDIYNFFKTHFGTKPESVTYNKPLMLGTQQVNVNIGEQLQTSASTAESPLGERAGVGEGYGSSFTGSHYFNEHGFVMTVISTIIDPQYYQGLPKYLEHKESYLDYPFPEFANIGNQAIYSREIFYGQYHEHPLTGQGHISPHTTGGQTNPAVMDEERTIYHNVENTLDAKDPESLKLGDVFGYISRYSDQKFKLDEIHGEFRESLNYWQTARTFVAPQVLGHDFINYEFCGFTNRLNRIFAVEEGADHFYFDIFNNVTVKRQLPVICNPHM